MLIVKLYPKDTSLQAGLAEEKDSAKEDISFDSSEKVGGFDLLSDTWSFCGEFLNATAFFGIEQHFSQLQLRFGEFAQPGQGLCRLFVPAAAPLPQANRPTEGNCWQGQETKANCRLELLFKLLLHCDFYVLPLFELNSHVFGLILFLLNKECCEKTTGNFFVEFYNLDLQVKRLVLRDTLTCSQSSSIILWNTIENRNFKK